MITAFCIIFLFKQKVRKVVWLSLFLCVGSCCVVCWLRLQTRVSVARRAEEPRARGGVPDTSLLEVLPNAHAGGHLLPPHHNGGRLRRAREYHANPPLLLYSADSANMPLQHCRWLGGVPTSGCVFWKSLYPVSRWSGKLKWKHTGRLQSLR